MYGNSNDHEKENSHCVCFSYHLCVSIAFCLGVYDRNDITETLLVYPTLDSNDVPGTIYRQVIATIDDVDTLPMLITESPYDCCVACTTLSNFRDNSAQCIPPLDRPWAKAHRATLATQS